MRTANAGRLRRADGNISRNRRTDFLIRPDVGAAVVLPHWHIGVAVQLPPQQGESLDGLGSPSYVSIANAQKLMKQLWIDSQSEADTVRLGRALADVLPDGRTVALCGTLGAGKTRLVQAIAEAVGVDRRNVPVPPSS